MGTNVYANLRQPSDFMEYDKVEQLAKNHDFDGIRKWIERQNENMSNNTIHIGKRSGGWKFLFNHNNWQYYDYTRESIDSFLRECYEIEDEYGEKMSVDDFWANFVDSMSDGMTGEEYCDYEIQKAKDVADGKIEDKFGLYMTLEQAKRHKEQARVHNFYEEKFNKNGEKIPTDLGYRFSDSTDFC